jgi:hypothetical protein
MDYIKGTRVRHPNASEWGLGEILENSAGDYVRVFFVGAGEKKLSLKGLELERVAGENARHPILDNLKITTDNNLRYRTLPECIQLFLIENPAGFYGETFTSKERDYKLVAHHDLKEALGKKVFKELLGKRDYEEVCRRALKSVSATNLVHLHEKLSLRNGLATGELKQQFATVLYDYLFGNAPLKQRFNDLRDFLDAIKAAKWTIITFFPFMMFPEQHMFIKPTITNNAADICGFDIHYRPELNWKTYQAVLKFSLYLKEAISELRPRDMIDVQSFMWCIRPNRSATGKVKKSSHADRHE